MFSTSSTKCHLWVHDERFSKLDIIIHPDTMPDVHVGDVLEIVQVPAQHQDQKTTKSHLRSVSVPTVPIATTPRKDRLFIQLTDLDLEIVAKQPHLQLSLNSQIAAIFDLQSRKDVMITKVNPLTVAADYIELSFRDQYIGRGDMFRLKHHLLNTCVYTSKKVIIAGCIRAQIKEIYSAGTICSSGYITQSTKMIFRSESAKYFIFLQLSEEMLTFDLNGDLYFEKTMYGFLPELFSRWRAIGANHVVSIVLFSRVLYEPDDYTAYQLVSDPCVRCDGPVGLHYKDFYKVITDWEIRADWNSVLPEVKREAYIFFRNILERFHGGVSVLVGRPAPARQGNVLEAVNLALNIFDKHYVDRDLLRTGLSIVVVSPSRGMIDTTYEMIQLTSERMIEDGIGLDWVCLNQPPLYIVPLFRYKNPLAVPVKPSLSPSIKRRSAHTESQSFDFKPVVSEIEIVDWCYDVPHWVDMSFYDSFCQPPHWRALKYCPRAAVIRDGNAENRNRDLTIGVPALSMTGLDMDEYDRCVFTTFIGGQGAAKADTSIRPSGLLSKHLNSNFAEGNAFENDSQKRLSNSRPSSYGSPEQYVHGSYSPGRTTSDNFGTNVPAKETIRSVDNSMSTESRSANAMSPVQHHLITNPISIRPSKKDDVVEYSRNSYRLAQSLGRSPSKRNLNVDDRMSGVVGLADKAKPIIDPCNPNKNTVKMSSQLRRWHHIFPRIARKSAPRLVKWTSLCTPACLPLTTDYFPTVKELADLFQEYTYTVSLNDEWNSREGSQVDSQLRTESLLMELISQRLAKGFQLVIGDTGSEKFNGNVSNFSTYSRFASSTPSKIQPFPFSVTSPTSNRYIDNRNSANASLAAPIYLSMGNQVHRLVYDYGGQNVEVKRYVRDNGEQSTKIEYKCAMCTKEQNQFSIRSTSFSRPQSENYNWNYLDHLVSGYQEELVESLKFWRTRFIMIPLDSVSSSSILNPSGETLTDEEVRLAGFTKFIELLMKAACSPLDTNAGTTLNRVKEAVRGVPVTFTTFNTSTYVLNQISRWQLGGDIMRIEESPSARLSISDGLLTKDTKLSVVVSHMQNPAYGVQIKDTRWHLRYYENVFVGSELVDWMVKSFSDISSREAAVEYGNVLLSSGMFQHVNLKHRFLDGHYFYRFVVAKEEARKDDKPSKPLQRWFRSKYALDKEGTESKAADLPTRPPFEKVGLSRKVVIDLDPSGKSYRKELAVLHFDAIHNPKNCYHFHLHWLVCTARLVEDTLQSWSRFAEKCGLRLVEAPIEQAKLDDTDDNPFQSPIEIYLSVQPPNVADRKLDDAVKMPQDFFETQLIKHFGFILDFEADEKFDKDHVHYSFSRQPCKYTQFVHPSGIAFIQIREPGNGFLWANNRLLISHSQSGYGSKQSFPSPDNLRKEFNSFCSDKKRLSEFWNNTLNQLSVPMLMEDTTDETLLIASSTS